MQIGPYQISTPVVAAPMAGVTDKPYRQVCRQYGAGMVVSEMITSQKDLRDSTKTKFRSDLIGEPEPVVVQIVGTEPNVLAEAAQYNVANGAQIIDINMGCPAKKVCKKAAGSALLANEPLVQQILTTVVNAVDVPVTVKIRTGTSPDQRNAVNIARIAEAAGISAITIHGRTRQCKFVGQVEYDSIAAAKLAVDIPVIVNGDIDSPESAQQVLNYTNADAVMIGRAAQGQPWLFQQIADYLAHGHYQAIPSADQRAATIHKHIEAIHHFYGDVMGVRLARKHIKWYLSHWSSTPSEAYRQAITQTENPTEQIELLQAFLQSTTAINKAA
nr:tRNA dihydrouridine synthase DusB [Arenicella xantha]